MKTMAFSILALAAFAASAQAQDCRPITCTVSQIGEVNSKLFSQTLTQEANDDNKCSIFEGGTEVALANGQEKVMFSAAEDQGKIYLQLDFGLIDYQKLFGSAGMEVSRAQLKEGAVKMDVSYFAYDGNQAGMLELVCQRVKNRFRPYLR